MYRYDRNRDISGKSSGGGVCFLINKNLCTDFHKEPLLLVGHVYLFVFFLH